MPEGQGSEIGHKHFQHPGRTTKQFGPKMDRFSFIVLDVSLQAMQADASLHKKFREGGQAIIFKANDFADPASSEVFQILSKMPALRQSAERLAAVCGASVSSVPTLADFVAGKNIPTSVAPAIGAKAKATAAPSYIGAFPVIDAKSFHAVSGSVGDKIELVGKIVSIKEGIGKRGRGTGKPYVFINFGPWNGDSSKITIWSEGLSKMSARPTQSWVGKWISVTGLVEPVYEGKHYGKPYRNVGITVTSDNEIIHITEAQAKYRLGGKSANAGGAPAKTRNADVLEALQGGRPEINKPKPQSSPTSSVPPRSKNEQILRGLQGGQTSFNSTQRPMQSGSTPTPTSQSSSGFFSKIPGWVWIIVAIAVFFVMTRRR